MRGFSVKAALAAGGILVVAAIAAPVLPVGAHDGAEGVVKERMELMKGMGDAMKALSQAATSGSDVTPEVKAAADTVATSTKHIVGLFPEGSDQGKTKALPAVWKDRPGFEKAATEALAAAKALAEAAASEDTFALMDAVNAMGLACRTCHRTYRQKDD